MYEASGWPQLLRWASLSCVVAADTVPLPSHGFCNTVSITTTLRSRSSYCTDLTVSCLDSGQCTIRSCSYTDTHIPQYLRQHHAGYRVRCCC
ncbi:hypothetical protein J3F83DRAFT_745944 [Trichoderma novae-zelandiae]